jgi:hypothetical protein
MLSGEAHAAAPFARRLIVFFTPNGTVHQHWRPSGTETDFTFPVGSVLEPLTPHRANHLVCDGIDFLQVDNHGGGTAQSATGGMSLDQFLARKMGQSSRFQSLEFGVQTSLWGATRSTRMSYSAPGVFASPEDNPRNAFQRLFGALGGDATAAQKQLQRRKSMLDLVRGELGELLDTTLVLWAKELGDSRLHTCRSVPFVLAGGTSSYFRYLRYSGASHQQLLTSVCHALGGYPGRLRGCLLVHPRPARRARLPLSSEHRAVRSARSLSVAVLSACASKSTAPTTWSSSPRT